MQLRHLALSGALGLALAAAGGPADGRDLTVVSWGGSYQDAQRQAVFEPYKRATGKALVEDSWNGGIGALRAKAEGPATWDVVQVETDELVLGCEEGILVPLDWAKLGGKDRYLPEAVHECGVGNIIWATVLAYDGDRFKDNPPKSWADFFDTKKYPGKRALRRGPRQALEFALLADGVPLDQVYKVLRTEEGVQRAFAKLDSIKGDLVWWEAGAQPPQLLASGEVVMTSAYNGRISAANRNEGRHFRIAWEAGYVYQIDSWVILANSDKKEEALDFIAFASQPQQQAKLAELIPYGPTRVDAAELIPEAVRNDIPGTPGNRAYGLFFDRDFWVDQVEKLTERFNAWAAQ
ncbi:Spermidine/putrescine-binding periplasmic protein [bacterium HR40]|nr:Spermidine/putrescine-binding periplasmic protein [bacterium HR40]